MEKFRSVQEVNKFFANNMCGIGGGGYSDCMLELTSPAKYARGIIPAGKHHVECYNGSISICDENRMIANWLSGETVKPLGAGEIHTTPCTWGDLEEYHGNLCIVQICECLSGKAAEFKFASQTDAIKLKLHRMLVSIKNKPVNSVSETENGFVMDTYHGLFEINVSGNVARHKYKGDIKEEKDLHAVADFIESFKR